ncbi:MAG: TetR/AcrR family transcriptional regulator [Myxococcota bacterium]
MSSSSPQNDGASLRRPGRPRLDKSGASGDASEVRDRLLDAAVEIAVEQGFDSAGLREIARRAEVSPGMISYYFGDRQGLYQAMFERVFARIREKVDAVLDAPARSTEDRVADLIRIQISSIAADPWLPTVVMRELLARKESPIREFIGEFVARGPISMMIERLEAAQADGTISDQYDARMLAMTISSLSGFPFLVLPIVGPHLGIDLDDDFPDRLIEHNQKLLSTALRAHSETA